MLCLIHGYALSGSGSNLWTRAVAQALCRSGETVHIVCQDRRPEQQDFVAAAYLYEPDGTRQMLFERTTPYTGRAILHRAQLNLLPVYVRPAADVKSMMSILDLPDNEIQIYLDRNERVLLRVVSENDVSAMHVNHVVLMSVVARRVSRRSGVPYAVMPHGSALELTLSMASILGQANASPTSPFVGPRSPPRAYLVQQRAPEPRGGQGRV
jgi:hypothetical protein